MATKRIEYSYLLRRRAYGEAVTMKKSALLPWLWTASIAAYVLALSLPPNACAQGQSKIEIVAGIIQPDTNSVAISPDARFMLSAFRGGTALWDVASGQLLRTFTGHSNSVHSVALLPDGARIISGSDDNSLKLWDLASGELLRTFVIPSHMRPGVSGVKSIALSRDGKLVASASGPVLVWEVATGQLRKLDDPASVPDWVQAVALSPDGNRVLGGGHELKVWDVARGHPRTLVGHKDKINSVVFRSDGTRALSGSDDGSVRLWDVDAGSLLQTFEGHTDGVTSVAFSTDGAVAMSASRDKTIRFWNATTGQSIRTLQSSERLSSFAFSADGTRVVAGGSGYPQLWNALTGQLLRTFQGYSTFLSAIAYSPQGSHLLSGGQSLQLWDLTTGRLARILGGHSGHVDAVALSPDGARALSGSRDKTMKLWEIATGRLLRSFEHTGQVSGVWFSSDGVRAYSGSPSTGLKIWEAETGNVLATYGNQPSALSSDRTMAVASTPYGSTLWDALTGTLVRKIGNDRSRPLSIAFSPDRTKLVTGDYDGGVKLWDTSAGQLLHTFTGHSSWVDSVTVSPDGAQVLSGGRDKILRLWDLPTGKLLRIFEGNASDVRAVAFSPDSQRIVSASVDGTIRIWGAHTGELILTLVARTMGDWLAITPQGFFAASGQGGQAIKVVRGFEFALIDQIRQSLFNPDLVREALAGDANGEVRDAAGVINLQKVWDSGPAPVVTILSPGDGSATVTDLATIQVRIDDRGKGVGRIEWRINGVTSAVTAKPNGSGPNHILTQQLALDPGDNIVEVVAYNGNNLLASLPTRIAIQFTGPADKLQPKLHILAIGINTYIDRGWRPADQTEALAFAPLGLAVKDATTFGDHLKRAAAGLYADVRLTTVTDAQATRDNLNKVIAQIAAEVHPRDTFILFAAAHGKSEGGRFYLIPQDYDGGPNPEALATRAVDQSMLQDWLANRIKAKKALILLDTCESGALVGGYTRSRTDAPSSEAALGRLHEATGRPVLTAAAEGKPAFEGYEGHGVFTWALLDALKNGDRDSNGLIELSELVAHVQDTVPKIAAKLNGRGVTAIAVRGSTGDAQSARFGSKGEDFALAQRRP